MSLHKIDHINIVVRDLEAAKQFFLELGFTVKREGELQGEWIDKLTQLSGVAAHYVGLTLPNDTVDLELLTFQNPETEQDDKTNTLHRTGLRHLAFQVDDIDLEVEKLKNRGTTFLSDVQTYGLANKKLCYFLGPENTVLEMAEYQKES
jgi:catechol 2,3-dioxygenase-like lactoylglutathione lyase family enzyme